MAIYTVTVRGFGHVSVRKIEAHSITEARFRALSECGISVSAKREPKRMR